MCAVGMDERVKLSGGERTMTHDVRGYQREVASTTSSRRNVSELAKVENCREVGGLISGRR